MKLFVGLGNPGEEYARHRHNVGFMAVERIAAAHHFAQWRRRFKGHAADGSLAGERIVLLRPGTYMNDSGRAVAEAARYLELGEGDIVVFHDELDLTPGRIRVKTGGGNAGHNGLRSIGAHLGNDFKRVRIGIGHPGSKEAVSPYVLHDFTKADRAWLEPLLDAIAAAAGHLARGEDARFLTEVARRIQESQAPPRRAGPSPRAVAAGAGERHPARERVEKRRSALAENLRKWLSGRGGPRERE